MWFIIPLTLQWIMLFEVDCKSYQGAEGWMYLGNGFRRVRQEGKNDLEVRGTIVFRDVGGIEMYEFWGKGTLLYIAYLDRC